jgi:hypothetical protein
LRIYQPNTEPLKTLNRRRWQATWRDGRERPTFQAFGQRKIAIPLITGACGKKKIKAKSWIPLLKKEGEHFDSLDAVRRQLFRKCARIETKIKERIDGNFSRNAGQVKQALNGQWEWSGCRKWEI